MDEVQPRDCHVLALEILRMDSSVEVWGFIIPTTLR